MKEVVILCLHINWWMWVVISPGVGHGRKVDYGWLHFCNISTFLTGSVRPCFALLWHEVISVCFIWIYDSIFQVFSNPCTSISSILIKYKFRCYQPQPEKNFILNTWIEEPPKSMCIPLYIWIYIYLIHLQARSIWNKPSLFWQECYFVYHFHHEVKYLTWTWVILLFIQPIIMY